MTYIYLFFAVILVWLSFKSFRGGIAYLRYFQAELARPTSGFLPFATVICPCRGLDDGLAENLSALFEQDYPAYEIVFVVDDRGDPCVDVIESVLRTAMSKIVVARRAHDTAQKVENLREAVLHASDRSEVFVSVDSDVRPAPDWLRSLVAPLADESVGAATGYRWFISERPTFASEMRSAWNASIASAFGHDSRSNFCWGGSTAIRRATFEKLDIREHWRGTLSDDFTVTRVVRDAGLPIVFVPNAVTASIGDCGFTQLVEFTTRQMKITRAYMPHLWLVSFFGSALFTGVMLAAFLIVVLSRTNTWLVWTSLGLLALVTVFSIAKAWLRLAAIRLVLTEHDVSVRGQLWTQNSFWLLTPPLFLYNSVAALLSRRITWRGTTYELKSPTETVIISD